MRLLLRETIPADQVNKTAYARKETWLTQPTLEITEFIWTALFWKRAMIFQSYELTQKKGMEWTTRLHSSPPGVKDRHKATVVLPSAQVGVGEDAHIPGHTCDGQRTTWQSTSQRLTPCYQELSPDVLSSWSSCLHVLVRLLWRDTMTKVSGSFAGPHSQS